MLYYEYQAEVLKMTVKRFTEQEKLLLRKNPYTYRVTDNMILLTVEFKETFWKLYIQGFSPVSIFRELGYDPDLLGQYRINNFAFKLKKSDRIRKVSYSRCWWRDKNSAEE